jgi:hypothetical protein
MKGLIIAFVFLSTNLFAQNFTHLVLQAKGDLNGDGLADSAVVKQDTLAETFPYMLQIYFAQVKGEYKLTVSSSKIIPAQFPEGKDGYRTGQGFDSIVIKNNTVTIKHQLLRGHFNHKFRYQNGNFELIGFSQVYSDGLGKMYQTDFNLSTGVRTYKEQRYDTDKILINRKEKKWIRPLPKLQDFIPFEIDL